MLSLRVTRLTKKQLNNQKKEEDISEQSSRENVVNKNIFYHTIYDILLPGICDVKTYKTFYKINTDQIIEYGFFRRIRFHFSCVPGVFILNIPRNRNELLELILWIILTEQEGSNGSKQQENI